MRADLDAAVGQLLDDARLAGAIREGVGSDDVRRLLCGVEHAVRMGTGDRAEVDRYLGVLLGGLRPHG